MNCVLSALESKLNFFIFLFLAAIERSLETFLFC